MSDKQQPEAVTLDSVEQALQHWRDNRDQYPASGIPDEIWLHIFSLETPARSASKLRVLFGLNSQQYQKKYSALIKSRTTPEKPAEKPAQLTSTSSKSFATFAEICLENTAAPPLLPEAQATKSTLKAIKTTKVNLDTLLDPTTVIVECIRNDGHRLKIHTSSERVETILQAFYSQMVPV